MRSGWLILLFAIKSGEGECCLGVNVIFLLSGIRKYIFFSGIPQNYLDTTKIARVKFYSNLLIAYPDECDSLPGFQIFQFII